MAIDITEENLQSVINQIAEGKTQIRLPNGSSVSYDEAEGLIQRYNFLKQEKSRMESANRKPYKVAVFIR